MADRARRAWDTIRRTTPADRRGCLVLLAGVLAGLLLLSSALALLCAVVALPQHLTALHDDTHRREDGHTSTGVVTDIRETRHVGDPDWTEYVPFVRTDVDGATVTILMRDDSADEQGVYHVGQRLRLVSDPDHPGVRRVLSDHIRDGLTGAVRTWTIVLVVSAVVFVPLMTVTVVWIRREDRRNRERRIERAAERIREREVEEARDRRRPSSA
ncbi:hypothetical protein [Curtobacterium sp. MCBD17_032]|uniref:hypothetical protein n=1 Tax=Curtobacterium sp. MCBD17_032 TaxID=2175659 RepID=UPI000DAA669F|nr:hypothetical protein [Curtobacterium sp. MCBD17_032]PZE84140.1 hypothetical protein DEI91_09600 [Curtobacterium sp. MCBD17_032]